MQRRDILRGLAALPFVQLLTANAWGKTPPEQKRNRSDGSCDPTQDPQCVNPGTLNVIFHGPFCFIRYKDHIEAFTRGAMGHVYGVGTWQKEYYMGKGIYYLTGVTSQASVSMDVTDKNALIFPQGYITDIDPQGLAYCKVVIPTPQRIEPLGLFKPHSKMNIFVGTNAKLAQTIETFGSSHVFTYPNVQNTSDNPLGLSSTDWKPEPNSLNAINLHIFATSIFQLDLDHTPSTFHNSMQMLFGSAIEMNPGAVGAQFDYIDPKPYPGVTAEEQLPLHLILKSKKLIPPRICDAASAFVTV